MRINSTTTRTGKHPLRRVEFVVDRSLPCHAIAERMRAAGLTAYALDDHFKQDAKHDEIVTTLNG